MEFNWKNNVIELDFDGKLAIKIEKTEDGIKVVGAMDGYGNSILDKVKELKPL